MFEREIGLIGEDKFKNIQRKKVMLFGLGGVGGYVAETLVRCGITKIGLCDFDVVSESNKNRQIIALDSTIGLKKVKALSERLKDINKDLIIEEYDFKIDETTIDNIPLDYDYYIDAVDDVNAKILIIERAYFNNIKIISSMGTGNKLDPTKFKISKINQTKVCPLARAVRQRLKALNIFDIPVLYSEEEVISTGFKTPQSIAFCPSVAGILIARYVILDSGS